MRILRINVLAALALAGVVVSLGLNRHAEIKLRERDTLFHQQSAQLAELFVEHQRLSNLVALAGTPSVEERLAELVKLRSEAQVLRRQVTESQSRLAETSQPRSWQTASMLDPTQRAGNVAVISDSDSEEYREQLYKMAWFSTNNPAMRDAFNLKYAIWQYTLAHQGEFPRRLDEVAPYVYKPGENPLAGTLKGRDPMAGADEFELVYQGSLQELTNVPGDAVALIRERQAWSTPRGRLARIYATTGGRIMLVESDDNFQSFEAQHVIPPPSVGQR